MFLCCWLISANFCGVTSLHILAKHSRIICLFKSKLLCLNVTTEQHCKCEGYQFLLATMAEKMEQNNAEKTCIHKHNTRANSFISETLQLFRKCVDLCIMINFSCDC